MEDAKQCTEGLRGSKIRDGLVIRHLYPEDNKGESSGEVGFRSPLWSQLVDHGESAVILTHLGPDKMAAI